MKHGPVEGDQPLSCAMIAFDRGTGILARVGWRGHWLSPKGGAMNG